MSGSSSRFGAISGMGSKELTLTDNSVSGTNGVAFHVPGVECGLTSGPSGNEAHSSSIGLAVFPVDNVQGSCYQVSNYFIWKCYDIAIYYNNRLSVVLINNTMAENTLGIYNQIIGPSAAAHLYAAKQCTVKDSIIIGTTSSYNCTTDQAKSTGISSQITGGHVGLVFASFMQGSNSAPFYDLTGIRSYPASMGIMNVEGVTFAHFKTVCGTKDVMLTTNKANDDGQHPVVTKEITKYDSENDSSFFIHRPNIEKINPRDCVDMDCDGLKKALIRDEDGTFLGTIRSVLSQSEWEWNGDPNRGLGDYRIPLEMLTTLTGERINVSSIAPHKGIIRTDQCIYRAAWQAYECHDLDYKMLIIESLDADTETRRLSPVAVLGDGYLDLINGPQDHSACRIGNCRKRLSTFMAIVATGKHYLLHFTTTSPQTLRFFLLNSNDNQVVTLGIWYSQSNRRDVYVNDELVLAKNARMVNGKYVVDPPSSPGEFVPATDSSDVTGTNFFDRDSNILYVLVRGSSPVKIVTNPSFIVSFQIPALTAEEFYGEALIHNLALFFDVPPEKIRVVNVVRESGRRRRRDVAEDMEIQFEISDPPKTDGNATENETLTTESLLNISSKFINEVQGGKDLSKELNVTISSIAVSEPLPEVREDGEYIIEDSDGKLTIPKSMNITIQPSASYETVQFPTQPCLKVYDEQDQPMTKLGSIGDPWHMTAYLISGANLSATLHGTTTVDVVGGWANFTDLTVSHYGNDFCLHFNKTYPINEKHLSTQSETFSVAKLEVALSNNISTEPLVMNKATEMRITLIDNTTRHRISDIAWRGHNWTATVSLVNVSDTTGNMSGSLHAIFDPDTGEAVFDSLTFDQIGLYFLTFHVTSSPEEYGINDNVQVQVVNEKQFALLNDNTTIVTNITVTFEENYQQIVGDNEASFGAMIANIIAQQNPDVTTTTIIPTSMVPKTTALDTTTTTAVTTTSAVDVTATTPVTTTTVDITTTTPVTTTTTPVTKTTTVDTTTTPPVTTTTTVDTTTSPPVTTTAVDSTTTTPVTTTTTVETTTTPTVTTTTTVDTTTSPPVTTTAVDSTTTTPVTTTTTVETTTTPTVTTTTTVDTTTTPPVTTTTTVDTTTTPTVTTTTTVDTTTTPPVTTTTAVDTTTTPTVTTTTTVDTTTSPPVTTTTTVDTTTTSPVTTITTVDTTTTPMVTTTTTVDTTTSPPVTTIAVDSTTTTPVTTTATVDTTTTPTVTTTTTVDTTTTPPVTTTTTVDTTTTPMVTTTTTVDTTTSPPGTTTTVDITTTTPVTTTATVDITTIPPVNTPTVDSTTTTPATTTTPEETSKSSNKNSGMSVPTLIVIVTTPSVLLAGIVVIFLITKYNRLRAQDAKEQLTRKDSSMVADNFHTTENQQGRNEYPYSSPFSITNNMKSYQTQLPRIQTNSVLRSVTPTITPSNFTYLGVGDNGHSSQTFYTGKQQNRFN
ncbi:fibrocystin-L-like [Mizuhopecten yessoensis]|uniref:fibrocystin-L-like n=1 Tax=Mizuhopecten yessoensis TaxID=6573 RepID=UPI000B458DD3|nr:fibrocystin-L-like [Mizuhopecten yessoensis]